jgi:hypothetical protein
MSRRLKVLIALGIVLGVAIVVPVIRHYQLRFAVESYISELKAKGEPMELAQVIPPPVPPDQNGAPYITNALADLESDSIAVTNTPPAMRMVAPGKAMVGWQQPDITDIQWATNTWEELGRELTRASNDLLSFRGLTNHPVLDFGLDYQKGFDLLFPYLMPLKRSVQWLSAAVLYDLHQGDPKDASSDVRAMLAIVKGETNERILISQLVRIALASISANATWEILQDPKASDSDLAQLQQDWQSLEFVSPLEQTMLFERVERSHEFQQIRESSEKFNKLWGYFYGPNAILASDSERSLLLRKWDEIRWRWFWSYQDESYGLQELQVVIEAARMAETNRSFQSAELFVNTNLTQLNRNQGSVDGLRGIFSANASGAALRKAARIQTARNVVVIAIALKRYELKHQQLPNTLDELIPEFLKSVPTDYMDGQPLRYRRNGDGTFLLYSVGENGQDDGGNPAFPKYFQSSNYYWQDSEALDWVWPQPATKQEIQNYYAHPPK